MIVAYKFFVASLMAVGAITLLFTVKNYQSLEQFSASYTLENKLTFIDFILDKILNFSLKTLRLSGIAAGLYAGMTAIEAVGLWHEKIWAEILVILLVGFSIPFEILESMHRATILNFIIFLVNLSVLWQFIIFINQKLSAIKKTIKTFKRIKYWLQF
ncbi:DUF2127 domain-containing protein [Synechococcus sp. PCC 6312]|uniref:DUF2127 domain-containing protein n=1 Tax=Synechococcus sp. (strain ATCC 27167 / PCC 6312) TaxID=195253 RepID=UPI00029F2716|nr:DUF2127 domain-containing protein [Synechococcus sp. PCC 6312]AFY61907.1 putative membrane protein (DUF2127) [Synechococcus sp. PCC 6312]